VGSASSDGGVEDGSDGLSVALGSGVTSAVVEVTDVWDRDGGDDADDGNDDEHFYEGEAGLEGGIAFRELHGVVWLLDIFDISDFHSSDPKL
jgi:hypothetical protein